MLTHREKHFCHTDSRCVELTEALEGLTRQQFEVGQCILQSVQSEDFCHPAVSAASWHIFSQKAESCV